MRANLVAAVCQALAAEGLDVSCFNGHSFFIGAAIMASVEVVGIHDVCSYLATSADSYVLLPSVFLTVLSFCMFVCLTVFCIGCFWLCLALYTCFQMFGSVAAARNSGGCLNTFCRHMVAYGCRPLHTWARLQ